MILDLHSIEKTGTSKFNHFAYADTLEDLPLTLPCDSLKRVDRSFYSETKERLSKLVVACQTDNDGFVSYLDEDGLILYGSLLGGNNQNFVNYKYISLIWETIELEHDIYQAEEEIQVYCDNIKKVAKHKQELNERLCNMTLDSVNA